MSGAAWILIAIAACLVAVLLILARGAERARARERPAVAPARPSTPTPRGTPWPPAPAGQDDPLVAHLLAAFRRADPFRQGASGAVDLSRAAVALSGEADDPTPMAFGAVLPLDADWSRSASSPAPLARASPSGGAPWADVELDLHREPNLAELARLERELGDELWRRAWPEMDVNDDEWLIVRVHGDLPHRRVVGVAS